MLLLFLLHVTSVGMTEAMAIPKHPHHPHVHFNNAGDSPSPLAVTDAIIQHIELESKVGGYRAAELKAGDVEKVYESAARLIGAERRGDASYNPKKEIALVESATVGWTRVFYSMLETKEREMELLARMNKTEGTYYNDAETEKKELVILVSEAEYAANLVACIKFARDHSRRSDKFRWRVLPIPSSTVECEEGDIMASVSSGVVDLEEFQSMLGGTYAIDGGDSGDKGRYLDPSSIVMVCITHIPTNSGIINPVNNIGDMVECFNTRQQRNKQQKLPQILYLVDACQSVGQIQVNVDDMQCHALAATGRKYLRGPRGTGFLYVQRQIANILEPSHVDHAAAPVVRIPAATRTSTVWLNDGLEGESEFGLSFSYQDGAARFEFWEASMATRLGLAESMDAALDIGMDKIEERCTHVGMLIRQHLGAMDRVKLYHNNSCSCGIVTFFVRDVDAKTIKERMQNGIDGIQFYISVVPATSTPLDSSRTGLGERSLVRASLSYFNTEDEIELFCKALEKVIDDASS